jgi:pimeloyl-ACP methyl ester carboxylesterase
MPKIGTQLLEIEYECGGPESGPRVLLLHGWPDDPRGWRQVTPFLADRGYRWVAPWLRGFGATRFLSDTTQRDGTGVALAQDAFQLADALNWNSFAVVGHDWGGRAAYLMAALQPERLTSIASLAIAYAPRGRFVVPSFPQSQRWWYQWFMTVDVGAEAVRSDPIGFARTQWESWSPPGWYEPTEFTAAAESFRNPDWMAITLNGYRSRWQPEPVDSRYDSLRAKVAATERLGVPTLLIQGDEDRCDPPEPSPDDDRYFTAAYHPIVLPGVGHFPAREAPVEVARALLSHLDSSACG